MKAALVWLAGRVDGLALAALAGFMAWLALVGPYWMYLNPKFALVTLGAAALLAVLSLYAVWHPISRPSLGRALCYLALAGLVWQAQSGIPSFSSTLDTDPFAASAIPAVPKASPPPQRLNAEGVPYVPINTVELGDIASKGPGPAFETPYVMRGYVMRDPDLDAKGQFVLYRVAIWCCFADATAVGFKVTVEPGASLPDKGSWQVVFGRLTAVTPPEAKEYALPGLPFSSISRTAHFAAEHMESAEPLPEELCMYQWHTKAPYAY